MVFFIVTKIGCEEVFVNQKLDELVAYKTHLRIYYIYQKIDEGRGNYSGTGF